MIKAEDYEYRVFWSEEDQAFIGKVTEFSSLSCIEDTQADAFFGIVDLVRFILEDMKETGEEPPEPLAFQTYSGKFALRMPPELHKKLAIQAKEQHVSLNQLLVSRL